MTREELACLTPPAPQASTPWRALLTAPPVWALPFATFCVNWVAGLLMSSTGSWEAVFYLAAGIALACAAVFSIFGSARAVTA